MTTTPAPHQAKTGARNLATLLAAVDAWNRGDLDGYLQLYAADATLHGYSREPMRLHAIADYYRAIFKAEAGSTLILRDLVVDDERIAARFDRTGPDESGSRDARAVVSGITILRFRDGCVTERWSVAHRRASGGLVRPEGLEPPLPAPEAGALSS